MSFSLLRVSLCQEPLGLSLLVDHKFDAPSDHRRLPMSFAWTLRFIRRSLVGLTVRTSILG